MRLPALLATALGLVLALAASASAATVASPGTVSALAADGERVAYASGRSRTDCDRVRLWTPRTGRVVRLGRTTPCVQTSTGTGIASVAIAGTRVLWLHYTGGNIREWSLFTATTTRPVPRRLAFVSADVDAPAPIVVGAGDASRFGDLLPYAVGRTVTVLRANGARRFSWTAPARVTALSAMDGELVVGMEDGRVTGLDASGTVIATARFAATPIDVVRLTGAAFVVQQGRTVTFQGGGAPRTRVLATGSRVEDAAGSRVFYVVRGSARMLDFGAGTDRVLGTATHVQTEGSTVVLAAGRTVRTLRAD